MNGTDTKNLQALEESLWRAETRFDRNYLNKILAEDFFEFGRSGRIYSREENISVPPQQIEATLPLMNFRLHYLDAANVLVTYVSEVKYGKVERANRSSIWTKTPKGWQIRFHQGTPVP